MAICTVRTASNYIYQDVAHGYVQTFTVNSNSQFARLRWKPNTKHYPAVLQVANPAYCYVFKATLFYAPVGASVPFSAGLCMNPRRQASSLF